MSGFRVRTARAASVSTATVKAESGSKKSKLKPCGRIGTKRNDMRYRAHGLDWASKLEADVYGFIARQAATTVRKCISGRDTVSYQTSVRGGVCGECGNTKIHQNHTYTPDLSARGAWPNVATDVVLEVKGFLRPKDKRILRAVHASGRIPNLCLLLARDNAKITDWARKFLKGMPVGAFTKDGIKVLV